MSFFDIFKINQYKTELREEKLIVESLKKDNENLKNMLTPELQEVYQKAKEIERLNIEVENLHKLKEKSNEEIEMLLLNIDELKKQLLSFDEQILMESFSLYKPRYNFENSQQYKDKLSQIRDQQKQMIKNKIAVTGDSNWTVNNNKSQGQKMVNDLIKLVLRSFNNECETCTLNVKYNNLNTCEKRIEKSFETLNKLGEIARIRIDFNYKMLKLQELYLVYEYQLKKQEEKEEQIALREQMRQEAEERKELEKQKKQIEKEEEKFNNKIESLTKSLKEESIDSEQYKLLAQKIDELEQQLRTIENKKEEIFNLQNGKAGYVYVISNLGSFGDNVFKIGMTRRLEPMDRIKELSSASVPFVFDVHSFIFSEDAVQLEKKLHEILHRKRLNKVNSRKEFFIVSLNELEKLVTEIDPTAEFNRSMVAEEYRISLLDEK